MKQRERQDLLASGSVKKKKKICLNNQEQCNQVMLITSSKVTKTLNKEHKEKRYKLLLLLLFLNFYSSWQKFEFFLKKSKIRGKTLWKAMLLSWKEKYYGWRFMEMMLMLELLVIMHSKSILRFIFHYFSYSYYLKFRKKKEKKIYQLI